MLPDRHFYSRIAPFVGWLLGLFVGSHIADEAAAAVLFVWLLS